MPAPITRLLENWSEGNSEALEQLIPLVYRELRRIAAARLRGERDAYTLQPTALVHEVYMRLVGSEVPDWQNRVHFYAIAGHLMRQILIQKARARNAGKRGSGVSPLSLEEVEPNAPEERGAAELCDALEALERENPRQAAIVELCYFGGLNTEELAVHFDVSASTVEREKRIGLARLRRALSAE